MRPARLPCPPRPPCRALAAGVIVCAIAWPACTLPALAAEPVIQAALTQPNATQADTALANQVLEATNRYRASQQLPALQPSTALAALAADHSGRMAQLRRLSHAGFNERFERARRTTCVENLAAGFTHAEPMLAGWQLSADHHRNLLDARVQEVGVASIAGHVTWLACSASGQR